jgi:glycosyltransferase involved in cell wall biosynthesis
MIEELATGVPVLAFGNGAAPEIVDSGETGYLCTDEDDMVAAIGRLGQIDRRSCRAAAERRFGMDRMAADYEQLYERVARQAATVPARRSAPFARSSYGGRHASERAAG